MGGEHAAMGAEPLADLANIVQARKHDQSITQGRRDRKRRDQPFGYCRDIKHVEGGWMFHAT
jgi:hypothetical protein